MTSNNNILDNIDLIREKILKFKSKDDFYFISVMWRRKDHLECPANENARMLANWCIKNVKYFDDHINLIKDYCNHFGARAYIKPQVRSCKKINRELLRFMVNQIDNYDLAYSTLTREVISGYHSSRDKRIVLDLDDDIFKTSNLKHQECFALAISIVETIHQEFKKTNRKKECENVVVIPTFNGYHVVTPGFDPRILEKYKLPKDTWHSDNDTILYAVKPLNEEETK